MASHLSVTPFSTGKRHVLGTSVLVASILLGWLFFALGREWFMIYIIFGGALILAFCARLDEKAGGTGGPAGAPERRSSGSAEPREKPRVTV
jgi:hypothetical protein